MARKIESGGDAPRTGRDHAFVRTFDALRDVLRRQAPRALVTRDEPGDYQIASHTRLDRVGRPLAAAGVQARKRYVSFHLIPVYAIPELAAAISPGLRARMQGKSCFNFTDIDQAHLDELAALTEKGIAMLEDIDLPWESNR